MKLGLSEVRWAKKWFKFIGKEILKHILAIFKYFVSQFWEILLKKYHMFQGHSETGTQVSNTGTVTLDEYFFNWLCVL